MIASQIGQSNSLIYGGNFAADAAQRHCGRAHSVEGLNVSDFMALVSARASPRGPFTLADPAGALAWKG
jgi:hypothetical protein